MLRESTQPWDGEDKRTFDLGPAAVGKTVERRQSRTSDGIDEQVFLGPQTGETHDEWVNRVADNTKKIIGYAGDVFRRTIEGLDIVEPAIPVGRQTELVFSEATKAEKDSCDLGDWFPDSVVSYESFDPWQELNPEGYLATGALVDAVMAQAVRTGAIKHPIINYLGLDRSAGKKKPTALTRAVRAIDPGIDDWVEHLPAAERLRPVAHPWSDATTFVSDEAGSITEVPMTPALQALVGGAEDGRAVREREAWERHVLHQIRPDIIMAIERTGALRLTSIGTGTGEPIMDTTSLILDELYPDKHVEAVVNGIDISESSLAIAAFIAGRKNALGKTRIDFRPARHNILTKEGIYEAVAGTAANLYESIGFTEYVPSDNPASHEESIQRERMAKVGCVSAEEFHRLIYENMPQGAVWLTGNMRDDSRQAPFVIHGLGWQGIIQRAPQDYMRIFREAGIPGAAVQMFLPGQNSSGVYNLAVITKL